ncbi:uncharacterized protein LOC144108270 [Amblyomma americanum]
MAVKKKKLCLSFHVSSSTTITTPSSPPSYIRHCLLKVEAGGGKVLKIRDKEIFNSTDPCMSYTCLAEEETVIAEGCVPLEVRGTQCRVEPGREAPFPACCPSPSCDYELGHKDPATESGV